MSYSESSRRAFLRSAGTAVGGSLIVLSLPSILAAREQATAAQTARAGFKTLTAEEAAELEAIAARIIPSDDTPGAREAGVIYFIDNVLGSQRKEMLEPLRQGLADLRSRVTAAHDTPLFRVLPASEQDELLKSIETTPFFDTIRYLTIAGTFTLPEYGGNRGEVGWTLLGFSHEHMYQPPFGYYDADYMKEGK